MNSQQLYELDETLDMSAGCSRQLYELDETLDMNSQQLYELDETLDMRECWVQSAAV